MIRVSQSKTQDEYRRQFFFISLVVVFSFLILAARLWYLQILNGEKWLRFSESNRIEARRIPAIRGRILDRNGKVIADSKPSFDLKVVPGQLQPTIDEAMRKVQKILHWSNAETEAAINKIKTQNRHDNFTIKQDITRDEIALISSNQFRLTGVKIVVVPSRKYIYGSLGSHMLGYLGEVGKKEMQAMKEQDSDEYGVGEFWGLSGVEKMYEPFLKGIDGIEPIIEDVWGREVRVDSVGGLLPSFQARADKEGLDVVLTIDLDLQQIAEKMLEGKRGSVIAMDPRSGEIYAMTSSPTYEPEKFVRGVETSYWRKMIMDPTKPLYNRSIQGVYPPASTFKAIMATAILEEHVADPTERVYCPGYYRVGREVKKCWKHEGHGYMNLKEAIQHSCDTYFYEMSRRVGIERIAKYAKEFGLGAKTGFPLSPGEARGLVPNEEWKKKVYKQPWVEGETLSVAIGQGALSVTPIQMAVAYSAIANGGNIVKPIPALRTQTYEGKVVENFAASETLRKIAIKKETMDKVMAGLSAVVNEQGGTGYGTVRSKFVRIAGKTGTAQASGRKFKTKDHAWFVGFAPDDDPEILVAVVIEEGLHGATAAGPIAKNIIELYIKKKEELEGGTITEEIAPDQKPDEKNADQKEAAIQKVIDEKVKEVQAQDTPLEETVPLDEPAPIEQTPMEVPQDPDMLNLEDNNEAH